MGKSCLNKLSGNITVGCTIPQVGVKNIYLMHAEDVALTADPSGIDVLTATVSSSGVVILVEGYKQNIQVTSAIRTMDASAKLDFNVSFKLPGVEATTQARARLRSLLTGRFCVLVEYVDGNNMFIGYTSPLECSGMDWDSNANAALATITLSAPEGSAGNYFMITAPAAMSSIKSKVGG